MSQVSEHFKLEEFAHSESHPDLVEPVPHQYEQNVIRLAKTILEPIRALVGVPLKILSGYRSWELNHAVGGSPTSQHMRAEAADFICPPLEMETVFRLLYDNRATIPCGQIIYYPLQHFIHVALPSSRYPDATYCVHKPPRLIYSIVRNNSYLELFLDPET